MWILVQTHFSQNVVPMFLLILLLLSLTLFIYFLMSVFGQLDN